MGSGGGGLVAGLQGLLVAYLVAPFRAPSMGRLPLPVARVAERTSVALQPARLRDGSSAGSPSIAAPSRIRSFEMISSDGCLA